MKKSKDSENLEKVFSSDHVMSLLESMSDGIQIISEQHEGIVSRLDTIDGHLDVIDGRLDKIEVRLDTIEVRLDTLETKVDNLEVRFDTLETKVDNLEVRFDTLETKVDTLQEDVTEIKHKLSQKVDLEDFQKLEKRLIKVEGFVLEFSKKH
ncbi:MAG: hypothetical protein WCJ25_03605 [Candidatus Moraniibacteriota bacterium]